MLISYLALTDVLLIFPFKSYCSSCHEIACFKVTEKSYNVATWTAERRRVKNAQNSQRRKASNAVLMT
jgi:hypothetical protein